MERSDMSSAGGTITIKGRTLFLNKLTMGDVSQLQIWMKERMPNPFETVKAALEVLDPGPAPEPPLPPKAEKKMSDEELVAWAKVKMDHFQMVKKWERANDNYDKARSELLLSAKADFESKAPAGREVANSLLRSADGVAMMLYLMAKPNHPDLDYDHLRVQVKESDIEEIYRILSRANELPQEIIEELERRNPQAAKELRAALQKK